MSKFSTFLGQVVPRGTNGGVSMPGTLAGAAGGLFMGLCFWFAGRCAIHVTFPFQVPLMESCRDPRTRIFKTLMRMHSELHNVSGQDLAQWFVLEQG